MDAELTSSSSTNSAETSTMKARIFWPGGPSINQIFSLPYTIILNMIMYPSSSKGYNKLIQTCKFFFEKNPILVMEYLTEQGICLNKECNHDVGDPADGCCYSFNRSDSKKIDINKITSKIWLTGQLYLDLYQSDIPNFASLLRPKIFRCDVDMFGIQSRTNDFINFDDFKFFASSAKWIDLCAQIVYDNGDPVMLENILEVLPKVEKIDFCDEFLVSSSTLKNMSKLNNLGNLKEMGLWLFDESCPLDDLFAFVKDHSHIKFYFQFNDDFLNDDFSEEYKNQLDQFVDSLIENTHLKVGVEYDDRNIEKCLFLYERYCM